MADAAESPKAIEIIDGCGDWGPEQNWATIWFVVVVLIGIIATLWFSGIDHYMYVTDAEVIDYRAMRENRMASTLVGSGNKDSRSSGDLASVRESVSGQRP